VESTKNLSSASSSFVKETQALWSPTVIYLRYFRCSPGDFVAVPTFVFAMLTGLPIFQPCKETGQRSKKKKQFLKGCTSAASSTSLVSSISDKFRLRESRIFPFLFGILLRARNDGVSKARILISCVSVEKREKLKKPIFSHQKVTRGLDLTFLSTDTTNSRRAANKATKTFNALTQQTVDKRYTDEGT
jgi:hypothetical protein